MGVIWKIENIDRADHVVRHMLLIPNGFSTRNGPAHCRRDRVPIGIHIGNNGVGHWLSLARRFEERPVEWFISHRAIGA